MYTNGTVVNIMGTFIDYKIPKRCKYSKTFL